ncbi:hypothetical protein ATJ88_3572 [Isoptericola jiangsuensis]|uniref:Uncharacterized protein n=1 Tax=Isoptericola jiangsuensis TaxID=548579 RepID=A0A2A9F309_9MICO|nr:hypothetical protein ATJ88_3572 [Isoptericola jiangsuensis]
MLPVRPFRAGMRTVAVGGVTDPTGTGLIPRRICIHTVA